MTYRRHRNDLPPTSADKPPLLEKALEKNQEVKDKVESCAVELFTVNETARKEIVAGSTLQQVERTLARSESVEDKVQECADDLHEVNEALKHEVDDRNKLNRELMETGQELSVAQNILSSTQDVLAVAHKVAEEASALLVRSEEIQTELRHDITRGQLAEKTLFEEKERLRVTLNHIGDAVIATDMSGKVTYLNPVAETMTGWTSEEAKGHSLSDVFNIIHSQTDESAPNPIELIFQGKTDVGLALHTVLIQRSGNTFNIEDSAALIRDHHGKIIGAVLIFHDVTQALDMAARMTYQASHDALTGLIDRREFERRLEQALLGKKDGKQHTLLYLDLDQFKIVNDTCGHMAGDALLKQLTSILQAQLRTNDTLARVGGDEFGLLLESCPTESALRLADLLRQTVHEFPFIWKDKVFQLGLSIGLVTFGNGSETLPDILHMADAACYLAKDKGRNRVQIYTAEDMGIAQRHGEMGWVGRIRKALEEQRFVLYSQKILSLVNSPDAGEHYEVLLRMQDEDGKLVPPMAFIPAAERYGLMPQLDRWVITTAFTQYSRRHPAGSALGTCAINLSGASICDENFYEFVVSQLELLKVPPAGICFEITETSAITNLPQAAVLIFKLKELGCRFSLDDFGSGMSSFAYLKQLPVDYLKIDGSFVKDMIDDPIDRAMVEAINHIGHVMQIETIAEFVENDAILEALRRIGVHYAQGYGIERPRLSNF
ncbi:MAG: EAL domain-containing protein [Pseudomonadota bacterium]|nr:EAL domain-containing protein [Pseudomonadota bacterium]